MRGGGDGDGRRRGGAGGNVPSVILMLRVWF